MAGKGVQDRDRGYRNLVRNIRAGEHARDGVTVGVHSDTGSYENGLSIAEVAAIHEFGDGAHIPERSWLRSYVDANKGKVQAKIRALNVRLARGEITRAQALDQLGGWVAAEVQEHVRAGIPPPNAESTVRQKGSSTPLVDSGAFVSAIDYQKD